MKIKEKKERIFTKGNETKEIKDELSKIKRYEDKVIRDNLFYDLSNQPFDFRIFKTKRFFSDDIYNKRVDIDEAYQEQSDLFGYFFLTLIARQSRSQKKDKRRKKDVFDSVENLYNGRELVINAFKSESFPLNSTTGTRLNS